VFASSMPLFHRVRALRWPRCQPTTLPNGLCRTGLALLRHQTFYKAVFRPAVLRANRLGGDGPGASVPLLPPGLKFHALRHTYASLCVAAGIPPLQLSRFMGHAKVTTTLAIYTHLFDDEHAETMVALEAMSRRPR
jgi:integrase